MKYTIYNPTTGKILSVISSSDAESLAAMLDGQSYVEGDLTGQNVYIENGQVTPLPVDPSNDLQKYDFDWATKTWTLNNNKSAANVRIRRNVLLGSVDKVNPIRFSLLSDIEKTELAEYRQALLDVPAQSGFPASVVWPTKPAWL